jgi:multimeric flavodoxin WrbA
MEQQGQPPARYDDLRALFINCTLKRSPEPSHTDHLMEASRHILREQGVSVETVRAVDHHIAPGVQPDMTEHGHERDDWPALYEKVHAAHILVIGTPIWLGEKSSVCSRVIERLYSQSGETNEKGQYVYYGRVGGCIVTGNEDGVKHVGMGVMYALQHLGYVIPPQCDAGWIGEAGPGPSYGDRPSEGSDEGPVGFDNEFTQRNVTFMSWNLMHLARMLKDAGGIPAYGNQRSAWEAGERFGFENPEYR